MGAEFRTDVAEDAPAKPIDPRVAAVVAAVRSESRTAVDKLMAHDPGLITARDEAGSTLLHHAAGFGTLDTMTALVDAGAEVNAKNKRGSTPLHWAIHDEAKVRLLLVRGAAVNVKQVEGRTPLLQAASLGNGNSILRLLLERGADSNVATLNGQTPLMAAAIRGDTEALRLLIDAKANVNARNGAGESALMLLHLAATVFRKRLPVRPGSVYFHGRHRVGLDGIDRGVGAADQHAAIGSRPAVYNLYIMRRTQIYLTEEQRRLLEGRSRATGRTISRLIRDAIDGAYARSGQMSRAERVRIARRTAGAWTEFAETGAEYIERIRGARRLARLHGTR